MCKINELYDLNGQSTKNGSQHITLLKTFVVVVYLCPTVCLS